MNNDKESKTRKRISELMDSLNDNGDLVDKVHAAVSKGFFVPGSIHAKTEFEDKCVTVDRIPNLFLRDFITS